MSLKWSKVLNLPMEANLILLDSKINLMVINFFATVIQAPKDTYHRQKSLRHLKLDFVFFPNTSRVFYTARLLIRIYLREQLIAKSTFNPRCWHCQP